MCPWRAKDEKGSVITKAEVRVIVIAGCYGGRGPSTKEYGQPLEAGKVKDTNTALDFQKECNTDFSLVRPISDMISKTAR